MLKFLFGSKNDRYLKKLNPIIAQINELEPKMEALADEDFSRIIAEWKEQVQSGSKTLDDLLPECFALVREAGKRVFDPPMRHFDVQLIGGYVLHQGKIAEMKTGEGKTLVATLPVVLNALSGKGVHVITVNDYLASRDAEWMNQLYSFLGLSLGVIVHGISDKERQEAYRADITYGTNNEFGFDYLRDNMKFYKEQLVQRPLNFAIVDEVDSILIDEARTPLIISGPGEKSSGLYRRVDSIIPSLVKSTPIDPEDKDAVPDGDFVLDEKTKSATLTDAGVEKVEKMLEVDNLFDPQHISLQHHVLQALKAHHCFQKDVEYIVKDNQVVLVDEFTGRLMPGRRLSDGLHQAIEAKENVKVEAENQTLASITFQNYFRMYDKLAGMTGTADTESVEFNQIYNLEVIVIPTHREMIRKDHPDAIYKTQEQKYIAIAEDIADCYHRGQPTLVGTVSIEKSELLSHLLKKHKVPHNVLNAKQHEREAEIVAEAGHKKKVTIATNMAGRGTDIKLGEGVRELGGLHIIGTERHESRRIDNQLRGRSGRQGDPGSSRFYLALDDDLMRLFGSDRLQGIMNKLGLEDGMAIENKMVSNAIEKSQTRVEAHHFEIRKQLLEYDDVMNQQREVIYTLRRELMEAGDVEDVARSYASDLLEETLAPALTMKDADDETVESVRARLEEVFNFERFDAWHEEKLPTMEMAEGWVDDIFAYLRTSTGDHYQEILRYFLLDSLDRNWKEHLLNMDHLRDGIGLRGYGQKDPKQEYKREGFELFSELVYTIKENAMRAFSHLRIEAEVKDEEFQHEQSDELEYTDHESEKDKKPQTVKRAAPKVSRNAPCPCGSGKKYKKCCGA
ncbi:preprotein translocase subunit, ATPase [Pseudodesulfovibrio profundus]|uniref:Protein translocase subunit SecA n=1 Tax=Pseudodesulfovibrio profundus TaxID=57320 RepID=A0A2C8FAJ0_9BACT|nr:preprotein translocase subunit SecA [Pseudodesulfovibrio profundus]MBC15918.1 preprotein translocase subunit SecA [Desulfovibrio sp.]SOB59468.1 preprotein translocase subunit, ATPase [Pseudodesulfovibrio profundus]|tara:strand:- start:3632 stop:6178 length:2547 start_codon:yes stop_codon:yes gene_type:complete